MDTNNVVTMRDLVGSAAAEHAYTIRTRLVLEMENTYYCANVQEAYEAARNFAQRQGEVVECSHELLGEDKA